MDGNSATTDRCVLREQYTYDRHLVARQSLWKSRTGPSLYETAIDIAALTGTESIVDVGCGNGEYLALLRQRGHRGRLIGLDLSEGMARRSRAHAFTAVADAQTLPLRDRVVDAALCMHMLYHVPDLPRAIGELRRIVRQGGKVLVSTNGPGHTAQAKAILARAAARVAGIDADRQWDSRRFSPAIARELLATVFDDVDVHELADVTPVPDPAMVSGYLASWPPQSVGLTAGATWDAILAHADELIAEHFAGHTTFDLSSHVAILVCR